MSENNTKEQPKNQSQYPSEFIDLPSEGKIYPENHPLSEGKIEIKYMTAKEEDILTSQNLIKKGIVIDQLLNSLILTPGVSVEDLYVGDKNAVMVAARILAYGPEYLVDILDPETGKVVENHKFNLSDLEYKKFPKELEIKENRFFMKLPVSKSEIEFKLLFGKDEALINKELESFKKLNENRDITTRLRYMITAVDGNTDTSFINNFVNNMLARDSLTFRNYWADIGPDIILQQNVTTEGGDEVMVDIPMTTNFFWPSE
tara:strand:+ start:471 stop:1250 length:780 start_codon:yes stop_codon:yes gene_type:complete